jgi:hypothetical protein
MQKETTMRYRVSQGFETLGDSCRKTYETREAAEAAAEKLRGEIAEMVSRLDTPDVEDDGTIDGTIPTGYSLELDAWAHAVALADGAATYGNAAGAYIAKQAVTIDVVN